MKSVCVYCGSRSGKRPEYNLAAEQTGQMLAKRDWRLVYGAGDVGLMGTVARSTQLAGGKTFGVIPEHLVRWEVGKSDLDSYIVTETMHERKKVMFMNADAVLMLPGGGGSLDEFFEALTWRQLGLHQKHIVLLDVEGYWQPLIALIDHFISEGFADASLKDFISVAETVEEAEAILETAFA